MKKWLVPAFAAFVMTVAACAGTPPQQENEVAPRSANLNRWVEEILSPYLVEQLGAHPKFKGRPFFIVRMKGDDVQAEIDDLTGQIREKIMDALMARPGINLAWRPAVRPWRHHQTLEDVTCGDYRKLEFYVGIDTGLTKVDRRLYVKVRCLDLKEASWVSGFGMSWEGTPGGSQLAALDRGRTDEYLRGLRPLPFTGTQPDLLAAYLARNLSCLLKQREMDDIKVYVDRKTAPGTPYFQTVFDLAGNYLARFREVRVTGGPGRGQREGPDGGACHPRDAFPGLGVRHVQGQGPVRAGRRDGGPTPNRRRFRRPDPFPDRSGYRAARCPRSSPLSDWSPPRTGPVAERKCPGAGGERHLREGDHLPAGACVAVEVAVSRPARIYLIGQDGRSEITRLYPSSCEAFNRMRRLLFPGETLRFPPRSGRIQSLILKEQPGTERVYAVAAADPRIAERFEEDLLGFQGLCTPGAKIPGREPGVEPGSGDPVILWQAYLDRMARESRGALEWQVRGFRHDS